jgi:hypothetical protein
LNVIYLFEDTEGAELPKLFKSGFSKETQDKIRYSNGNSNLKRQAGRIIRRENPDLLCVYVDLVPNNINTVDIFRGICDIALTEYRGKILVLPILGSEYYYIKSVMRLNLEIDSEIIDKYLSLVPYSGLEWLSSFSPARYNTFEKLGKLIIDHDFYYCISDPVDGEASFNHMDCLCRSTKENCVELNMQEKIYNILKEYKTLPLGSNYINSRSTEIGLSEALDTYEKRLDYIIEKAKGFKENSTEKLDKYYEIKDKFIKIRGVFNA